MDLQQHFEKVRQLIKEGQTKALRAAYAGQLTVYWQVGGYLYHRLQSAEFGEKVVEKLVDWLQEKEPGLKGFDKRSLYRMKEFYVTWYCLDWERLKEDGSVLLLEGGGGEVFENQFDIIVGSVTPQFKKKFNVLGSLSWTHHMEILRKAKSLEEKVFYLLLSIKEKYTVRELQRQMESGLYERQRLSTQRTAGTQHPDAAIFPQIFRDKYIFEFLDLPEPFTENDLQKGLVKRLKQFILEIGRDFTFMTRKLLILP